MVVLDFFQSILALRLLLSKFFEYKQKLNLENDTECVNIQ